MEGSAVCCLQFIIALCCLMDFFQGWDGRMERERKGGGGEGRKEKGREGKGKGREPADKEFERIIKRARDRRMQWGRTLRHMREFTLKTRGMKSLSM